MDAPLTVTWPEVAQRAGQAQSERLIQLAIGLQGDREMLLGGDSVALRDPASRRIVDKPTAVRSVYPVHHWCDTAHRRR
jgi:hypothetical protein